MALGTPMEDESRDRRVAELRVLQFEDPRSLIDQYCRIAGESPGSQMPRGVSFSRMIDTIVDNEVVTESAQNAKTR
jgi:hypothetical protein